MESRVKKRSKQKKKFLLTISIASVIIVGFASIGYSFIKNNVLASSDKQEKKVPHNRHNGYDSIKPGPDAWNESSDGPYPDINDKKLQVEVSIPNQRVMIEDSKGKVVYTMNCSTGKDDSTPRGTFYINDNKGQNFYNNKLNEGANYWTSFSKDNVYLFHSVPTDANGNYTEEGKKDFGRPASHGCIRLSVPDAQWFQNTIQPGTKVIIH